MSGRYWTTVSTYIANYDFFIYANYQPLWWNLRKTVCPLIFTTNFFQKFLIKNWPNWSTGEYVRVSPVRSRFDQHETRMRRKSVEKRKTTGWEKEKVGVAKVKGIKRLYGHRWVNGVAGSAVRASGGLEAAPREVVGVDAAMCSSVDARSAISRCRALTSSVRSVCTYLLLRPCLLLRLIRDRRDRTRQRSRQTKRQYSIAVDRCRKRVEKTKKEKKKKRKKRENWTGQDSSFYDDVSVAP